MEAGKKYVEQDLKTLVSDLKLVYHPRLKPSERPVIKNSSESYQVIIENWDQDTIQLFEQVKVVMLNAGNRVLGIMNVSVGGMHTALCDPKIVFMAAILSGATAIILTHNHPSGNLQPSNADESITQKLKAAGQLLDIMVKDHLIISTEGYYSFADEGKI